MISFVSAYTSAVYNEMKYRPDEQWKEEHEDFKVVQEDPSFLYSGEIGDNVDLTIVALNENSQSYSAIGVITDTYEEPSSNETPASPKSAPLDRGEQAKENEGSTQTVYVVRIVECEKPELVGRVFRMVSESGKIEDATFEDAEYEVSVDTGEELYDFDLALTGSKIASGIGTLKVIAHNEEHEGGIYANMLILEYIPEVGGNLPYNTIYCREPIGIETPMDFYPDVDHSTKQLGTIILHSHTPEPKSKHTITATAGKNGSISPSGDINVDDGDDMTFTFIPDEGFKTNSLNIDGNPQSPKSNQYTFTNVTENHIIHVEFKPITKHIITTSAGENGLISPSGDVEVDDGGTVTFTIIPDEGYTGLVSIDGKAPTQPKNNTYTFKNVTKDHTITVTFKQNK